MMAFILHSTCFKICGNTQQLNVNYIHSRTVVTVSTKLLVLYILSFLHYSYLTTIIPLKTEILHAKNMNSLKNVIIDGTTQQCIQLEPQLLFDLSNTRLIDVRIPCNYLNNIE